VFLHCCCLACAGQFVSCKELAFSTQNKITNNIVNSDGVEDKLLLNDKVKISASKNIGDVHVKQVSDNQSFYYRIPGAPRKIYSPLFCTYAIHINFTPVAISSLQYIFQ